MESNKQQTPWLLQRNQLSLLAIILPPIALLIVQCNKHKIKKKTAGNIQFFASVMTCFWLLKLLPHHWITFALLMLLIGLIFAALVVNAFK